MAKNLYITRTSCSQKVSNPKQIKRYYVHKKGFYKDSKEKQRNMSLVWILKKAKHTHTHTHTHTQNMHTHTHTYTHIYTHEHFYHFVSNKQEEVDVCLSSFEDCFPFMYEGE